MSAEPLTALLRDGKRIPLADFEKQRLTKQQLKAGAGPVPNRAMRRRAKKSGATTVRLTAEQKQAAKKERQRQQRVAKRAQRKAAA